jgi:hypothetical protein
MGPDRRLDEFAARQYGVFSLKQARDVGMTDRMVEGRLGSGSVGRPHTYIGSTGSAQDDQS